MIFGTLEKLNKKRPTKNNMRIIRQEIGKKGNNVENEARQNFISKHGERF